MTQRSKGAKRFVEQIRDIHPVPVKR